MGRPLASSAALAAALLTTTAFAADWRADWYGGLDVGSASLDESGAFGVPTGGFGGPTVDHDLCGGTATITVGAEPFVTRIDDSSTEYRLFLGKRFGAFAVEGGTFNIARAGGQADSAAYAVAQPTCNPVPTTPITVDAFGRKVETIAFDGYTVTPVYSFAFAEDWTLDLRATLAFWAQEERSQWQIVVTELSGTTPLQTYVTETATGDEGESGFDVWLGVGASWQVRDGLRLRGILEQQRFEDLSYLAWTIGVAIDFD